MADYTDLTTVKAYMGGQTGNTSDPVLGQLITRCSRMFDRETGRPNNFWAPATGITRRYSGSGTQWLDIDEFQTITAVTMSTTESRSDAITMTVTPPVLDSDPAWMNFVEFYPLNGPPFNQMFTLRSWLPDAYNVGNIAVTGNVITPDEIAHAVTIWVVYSEQSVRASWADVAGHVGVGGLSYKGGIPIDVQYVIDYYTESHRGPKAGLVSGDEAQRISPWLGWRTAP